MVRFAALDAYRTGMPTLGAALDEAAHTLEAALAAPQQAEAVPVAWRSRIPGYPWCYDERDPGALPGNSPLSDAFEVQALYAAREARHE
ncbi:hypothetical protein [Lysobacter sp. HA35]